MSFAIDPIQCLQISDENQDKWMLEIRKKIEKILYDKIIQKDIEFPFHKNSLEWPMCYFDRLKKCSPMFMYEKFYLSSYYAVNKFFLPPIFRGQSQIILSTDEHFSKIDVISDCFFEEKRLSIAKPGHLSPIDGWSDQRYLPKIVKKLSQDAINNENLRKSILSHIPEVRFFRSTWIIGILSLLNLGQPNNSDKILDVFAGWGDRLFVSMAKGLSYHGFVDSQREQEFKRALSMFGTNLQSFSKKDFLDFSYNCNDKYNCIFFFPPREDFPIFISPNPRENLSMESLREKWAFKYVPSLFAGWEHLDCEGYLILQISDTKNFQIGEAINLFIEQYLHGSIYEGVIGLAEGLPTGNFRAIPAWIWKKGSTIKPVNERRSLHRFYPNFDQACRKCLNFHNIKSK